MAHGQRGRTAVARRPTREVRIGALVVGGSRPIRVQSMTTTTTADARATADQIVRLVAAGCEIVRVTVPTTADADALPEIRRILRGRGIDAPLVADIHFTPAVAMRAVEHVDKIRINPGNFADKKRFAVREYTDTEYEAEIERIERSFAPLVDRCRELGVAMRIGTNHGSLSDRILNRYGDTADGMVESALEFARICEHRGLRDVVVSMKASNPVVVLEACRTLVARMDAEGLDLPVHLGVTEAGDGEDARIKSAIGIGALLEDGVGDTVRVSLTEDPVAEIPVARALVAPFQPGAGHDPHDAAPWSLPATGTLGSRRRCRVVQVGAVPVGGTHAPVVEVCVDARAHDPTTLAARLVAPTDGDRWRPEIVSFDLDTIDDLARVERITASRRAGADAPANSLRPRGTLGSRLAEAPFDRLAGAADRVHLTLATDDAVALVERAAAACRAAGAAMLLEGSDPGGCPERAAARVARALTLAHAAGDVAALAAIDPCVASSPLAGGRALARVLDGADLDVPIVLVDRPDERACDPLLGPAACLGGLLCEGIGDAVQIVRPDPGEAARLGFGVLQGARARMTRTEFISCPSCGRTLFDLEETTARIKRRTAHLADVKIAIMGCIVNGPGEMADADFGYVGWGEGRVALFVGCDLVARDVPTAEADERLVELIRAHGRWVDPPAAD